MLTTKITAENLVWINQERIKRKLNRPNLGLYDYKYITHEFYGIISLDEEDKIVSFEEFKQLTNPQTKNQIIELW